MKEINLLNKSPKKHSNGSSIGSYWILAILIMFIATGATGYFMAQRNLDLDTQIANNEETLVDTNKQIEKYKEDTADITNLNLQLQTIGELDKKRISWTDIIYEFSKTVPQNVQIDSFSADKSPLKFSITAKTISRQDIESFKKRIEDSTYFENVFYNSSSESGEGAAKRVTFSFTFSLKSPEGDKTQNAK